VGTFRWTGRAVAGSWSGTYDIAITDADGHRVCTSRLTCLIRDQARGPGLNGAGAG